MSEDAEIRRANLKRLCKHRGWSAAELHAAMGGVYSYWRDLLTDPKKSFGEKVARRIEDKLELGRNWLDQDRAAGSYPIASEPSAQFSIAEPAAPSLPFSAPLIAALVACGPERLAEIETALRAILHMAPLPGRTASRKARDEFQFNPPTPPAANKGLKRASANPKLRNRRSQK